MGVGYTKDGDLDLPIPPYKASAGPDMAKTAERGVLHITKADIIDSQKPRRGPKKEKNDGAIAMKQNNRKNQGKKGRKPPVVERGFEVIETLPAFESTYRIKEVIPASPPSPSGLANSRFLGPDENDYLVPIEGHTPSASSMYDMSFLSQSLPEDQVDLVPAKSTFKAIDAINTASWDMPAPSGQEPLNVCALIKCMTSQADI
jgi:hypothetical protein